MYMVTEYWLKLHIKRNPGYAHESSDGVQQLQLQFLTTAVEEAVMGLADLEVVSLVRPDLSGVGWSWQGVWAWGPSLPQSYQESLHGL